MNNLFHIITTWSSSLIILIMGGLLLLVGIPSKNQWKHLHYGCFTLSASYLILGSAGLTESIMEFSDKLISIKSQLVLCVSFFQALLFTETCLVLLHPQFLNIKNIAAQLAFLIPLVTFYSISYVYFPSVHSFLFYLIIALYIGQLGYYTSTFNEAYNKRLFEIEKQNYKGTIQRFRCIKQLFYASLSMGITALIYILIPSKHLIAELFTIVYTLFYVTLVFHIINYSRKKEFALDPNELEGQKGYYDPMAQTAVSISTSNDGTGINPVEREAAEEGDCYATKAEQRLALALEQWIKEERYLCPDVPLEEVANELNTDVDSLHDYFLSHKGVLFRTWRAMQRIEKAKQLLEMNPKIKITELQTMVGFTDKSYFFRRFKQMTGKTPNEYRNDLQDLS